MREEKEKPTPKKTKQPIKNKDKKYVIEAFMHKHPFSLVDGIRHWKIIDRKETAEKRDQVFTSLEKKIQSSAFNKRWYGEIRKRDL